MFPCTKKPGITSDIPQEMITVIPLKIQQANFALKNFWFKFLEGKFAMN